MSIINKELKGPNEELYSDLYMCRDCCLRYGRNIESGEWSELDGIIQVGWKEVLPRLNPGMSKRQIAIELGITSYMVTRYAGYFARIGLLEDRLIKDYLPPTGLYEDTVQYFKKIYKRGSLIELACKEFGWTQSQFWYVYYQTEVQNYLYTRVNRRRGAYKSPSEKVSAYWRDRFTRELNKDLKNGKKPELEDIAKRVGCTKETITRYKLSQIVSKARYNYDLHLKDYYWEQTREFVGEKMNQNQRLLLKDYFIFIGKSEKWINKRFPEMLAWVQEQIPIASQNRKDAVLRQRIEEAKTIVSELQTAGKPYGFTHVAERMGLHASTITYYTQLADAIREEAVSAEN